MQELSPSTPSPEITHDTLGAAWLRVNALGFDWNTAEDQRAWRYLLKTATALARKAPIQERCEALHVDAIDLATAIVEELAVGLEGADRVGGVLTRDFGECKDYAVARTRTALAVLGPLNDWHAGRGVFIFVDWGLA